MLNSRWKMSKHLLRLGVFDTSKSSALFGRAMLTWHLLNLSTLPSWSVVSPTFWLRDIILNYGLRSFLCAASRAAKSSEINGMRISNYSLETSLKG
jgi:hypothetical protein